MLRGNLINAPRYIRRNGAFTLMEIMLVLLILVLLAGALIAVLSGVRKSAEARTTELFLRQLQNAIEAFNLDTGTYPQSMSELVVNSQNRSGWNGPYIDVNQNSRFIAKDGENVTFIDAWGTALEYNYYGGGAAGKYIGYSVLSYGADATKGTNDDIEVKGGVIRESQ